MGTTTRTNSPSINKWMAIAEAEISQNTAWLTTPGNSNWQHKPGCPDTITRTFNSGKYSGIGPRVYAEMTAADGLLYWGLFIEDVKRRRGGYESRRIAGGRIVDIPTARPMLKARICRLAMAHVRKQLDHAIARTIEALSVSVAEHEGIAKAAADLDLADARAVVLWDRDNTRAEQAADATAKRLEQLLKLTNV
jgi:hypothetical protein